jgi:DNA polymerase (family 10)
MNDGNSARGLARAYERGRQHIRTLVALGSAGDSPASVGDPPPASTRPDYRPAARDPLPLATAEKLASKILAELKPFCERIEIAGSIRRRRPFVNDIDLVVLPHYDQVAALRERLLRNTTPISDGKEIILTRLANGFQVDLWIAQRPHKDLFSAHDTNFGALYLARTGSKDHNIWLCTIATRLGRHFNPQYGVFENRRCLASATEEEIFAALKLDFIPPEQRERPHQPSTLNSQPD